MKTNDVLIDAFERVHGVVGHVVDGLTVEQTTYRPDPDANSIAWLIWHLIRIQDDHVADVAGIEQVWTAQDFFTRFALPFDVGATGYGQGPAEVSAVRVDPPELLMRYHEAVHAMTVEYLRTIDGNDLDRIVDTRWDPPVTLGVRLVSVVADTHEHAGQAAYLRGIVLRR